MQAKTKLGSVALLVDATVTAGKEADLMLLGVRYLLNHNVAGKAFHKDTGFDTKSPYTPAAVANVDKHTRAVLGEYCTVDALTLTEYVATANKVEVAVNAERQKAYNALKGLDAALAATMYPECAAAEAVVANADADGDATE